MQFRQNNKNNVIRYSGLTDLRESVAQMKTEISSQNKSLYKDTYRDMQQPQGDWCSKSIHEVDKCLEDGWLDNLGKIKATTRAVRESVNMVLPDRRRKRRRSDTHGEVDVDRLLSARMDGLFANKIRSECLTSSPVITLILQWGGNCGMSEEKLFWTSVPALVLTELLENAGYRVHLIAANPGTHTFSSVGGKTKSTSTHVLIDVKRPEQALRTAQLAAMICLPATFRTYGFLAIIQAGEMAESTVSHGLGRTAEYARDTIEELFPEIKAQDSYVLEYSPNKEAAVAMTEKAMKHFASNRGTVVLTDSAPV